MLSYVHHLPPPQERTSKQLPYTMLRETTAGKKFNFNASKLAKFWQNKG